MQSAGSMEKVWALLKQLSSASWDEGLGCEIDFCVMLAQVDGHE